MSEMVHIQIDREEKAFAESRIFDILASLCYEAEQAGITVANASAKGDRDKSGVKILSIDVREVSLEALNTFWKRLGIPSGFGIVHHMNAIGLTFSGDGIVTLLETRAKNRQYAVGDTRNCASWRCTYLLFQQDIGKSTYVT